MPLDANSGPLRLPNGTGIPLKLIPLT